MPYLLVVTSRYSMWCRRKICQAYRKADRLLLNLWSRHSVRPYQAWNTNKEALKFTIDSSKTKKDAQKYANKSRLKKLKTRLRKNRCSILLRLWWTIREWNDHLMHSCRSSRTLRWNALRKLGRWRYRDISRRNSIARSMLLRQTLIAKRLSKGSINRKLVINLTPTPARSICDSTSLKSQRTRCLTVHPLSNSQALRNKHSYLERPWLGISHHYKIASTDYMEMPSPGTKNASNSPRVTASNWSRVNSSSCIKRTRITTCGLSWKKTLQPSSSRIR